MYGNLPADDDLSYNIRMLFNWVDWIILLIVSYEVFLGWRIGFVALGVSFISFAVSLWLAIVYSMPVSHFFTEKFGIAAVWSSLLSYLLIILGAQTIVSYLLSFFVTKIPEKIEKSVINSALGSLISGANTITTVAFVLLVILALPLKGTVQKDIRESFLGGKILHFIEAYGGPIKKTAEDIKDTASKFLTVSPGSTATMPLDISVKESDLVVDDQKEREMLVLMNEERSKVGAKPLTVDVRIVSVARQHSTDMFLKKYFSHISQDGSTLEDRLKKGGVTYMFAGENIAYAPDVKSAHIGLMNSADHKKNMLDPDFYHVGIGIISTSRFGIMVTQNFTN